MAIENDDNRELMIDLYDTYYSLMYEKAKYIVKDAFVAEDMVQETLAKLIDSIGITRKIECCVLPAYLVICIKRTCIDYLRREKVGRSTRQRAWMMSSIILNMRTIQRMLRLRY